MKQERARGPTCLDWAGIFLGGLFVCTSFAIYALEDRVRQDRSLPMIAIIIDDLGYRENEDYQAINLPGSLTFAVLPHTPHATSLAQRAHRNGKEILLHLPMESNLGHQLGPGGLTTNMPRRQLITELSKDLSAVPHIAGVSNHMGSRLGASRRTLSWIMQFIGTNYGGLYFVDSRTSPDSLIAQIAAANGIPSITRDIFLDNEPTPSAIKQQFSRLISLAKRRGGALAIGHPHPSTIAVLRHELKRLPHHGVQLVPASALLGQSISHRLWTATPSITDIGQQEQKTTTP